MAIDVYHGTYVTAEDANDYIDVNTIQSGCSMMKEAADKITAIKDKINTLKELCDGDTLTINGQTMEDQIQEFEDNTNNFALYINELSETVSSAATRALNKKQIIFNEEAKKRDNQFTEEYNYTEE